MFLRKSLVMLLPLVALAAAYGQDLSWVNPDQLPPPLDKPLKLLATTAMSGKGQDYFTLKPKATAVVGTITGPAIIFRVWSTSSASATVSLDMTVDGKKQTLYEKGKPVGLGAGDPLRAMDKQAYWSYVPVAVRQKAVFTARSTDPTNDIKFYLQVGYRPVAPGELKLVDRATRDTRIAVENLMRMPRTVRMPSVGSGAATVRQPFLAPITTPTLVRATEITLPADATIEQVQATRLTITCDGSKTVDVPLGALFGEYWQLTDYTSTAMAVAGKTLTLRFPMPVAQSLQFAISNYNGRGLPQVNIALFGSKLAAAPKYHFCAQYFSQVSVKDQPMTLLNATGPGIFVGSNLAADGIERKTFAFLEGNEQIYVDGATTPTLEGTGTEDYFNNSWYFETGQLARPLHGVTFLQPKDPPRVVAYRWMIPDCVPFKSSLKFDLQHGSRNGAPNVLYHGVMFWYQQGPVIVAEPVEAKLPAEQGAQAGPDTGWVTPSVLGASILFLFVLIATMVMLHRRRVRL